MPMIFIGVAPEAGHARGIRRYVDSIDSAIRRA